MTLKPEDLNWATWLNKEPKGVLIALDKQIEWMLPWWWENYSKHNTIPLAFIDFGMTPGMAEWCKGKGSYIPYPYPEFPVATRDEINPELVALWEEGTDPDYIWKSRYTWLCKPLALTLTPFQQTVWLDIDCEVLGPLDRILKYLKTQGLYDEGKELFNCGVVAYRENNPLILEWAQECIQKNYLFRDDKDILCDMLYRKKIHISNLPQKYNWRANINGYNPDAIVIHWVGTRGKKIIAKSLTSEFPNYIPPKANNIQWSGNYQKGDRGVLIASDSFSEVCLPWCVHNYRFHNSLPIVFIDLGMSTKAQTWCKQYGQVISFHNPIKVAQKEEINIKIVDIWESRHLGVFFWKARQKWFNKPFALLLTPFEYTLWLDIDCQVMGSIEPLFDLIQSDPVGLALAKQDDQFNSGVIPYRYGIPLITKWAKECIEMNHIFLGDQDVLSYIIQKEKLKIPIVPPKYNWRSVNEGENPEAQILHWAGPTAKKYIGEQLKSFEKIS
jgi:hypothetical protein